jgi:type IV pilus assembly protein PilN
MKITVNLATRPFVELGSIYNRLRTWMAILVVLGLALWFMYRSERVQAEGKMAYVASVRTEVKQLQQQRASYQALMQQPTDAAILAQSDYLNDRFKHKAFSWTATMTDLETVLPSGVEVLSIDPIVAKDGHVTIRLRVTGGRDHALDLIRNLEQSKHFVQPRLATESLATGNGPPGMVQDISGNSAVNFDILADYRPLPLPAAGDEEKPAEAEKPATKHPGVKRPLGVKKPLGTKKPQADRTPGPAAVPKGAPAPAGRPQP